MNYRVVVHFEQPVLDPNITAPAPPPIEPAEITAVKLPKESLDETEIVVKPIGDGPERRFSLLSGPGTVEWVETHPLKGA